MSFRRRNFWLKRMVLGFAVAAIAAPMAQARVDEGLGAAGSAAAGSTIESAPQYGIPSTQWNAYSAAIKPTESAPQYGIPSTQWEKYSASIKPSAGTESPDYGIPYSQWEDYAASIKPSTVGVVGLRPGGQPITDEQPRNLIPDGKPDGSQPQLRGDETGFVRANPDGYVYLPSPDVTSVPVSATSDGFDWSDAGLGFGVAAALVLLAGGAALSLRNRGKLATGF